MHRHWEGGPVCKFRTKKECEDAYADAQADAWVRLAAVVVAEGRQARFLKQASLFAQVVAVLADKREDIEGTSGFTGKLRDALRRHATS